ncbi:MAG TPA: glycosyltransferase family 39 protein [Acidimicrobiales bacterium]
MIGILKFSGQTQDGIALRSPRSPSRNLRARFEGWGGTFLVVLVASAGFLGLGLHEAWVDAPTFDEPVYVASGLAAVLHQDLDLNDEHPPLAKVLAVLPVLFVHPFVPADGHWDHNDERTYSAAFVDAQVHAGTLRSVTFAARVVPLLEAVGLALVLYRLGRDLFGRAAGTTAALLWLLSPWVLGLGHLDSVDVSFALAVALWSWMLLRWFVRPDWGRTLALGALSAVVVTCDVPGLLLAGLGALCVLVAASRRSWRAGVAQGAAVLGTAWVLTWLLYVCLDPRVLLDPTVILPAPYLHGINYLATNDTVAGPGYLLGTSWVGGRWWYWPAGLLVKMVPTTLLVLIVGPLGWRFVDPLTRRRAGAVLALPGLGLLAVTVATPRDIGVRYLLPVVALWLVAASALVPWLLGHAGGRAAVAVAIGLAAAAAASSAPASLAWVSPPLGPGYQVASNSDIDWGQGFFALQAWSAGRHPWVAYFGPRGLGVRNVRGARRLLGVPPGRVTGWVAVSATDLTTAERSRLLWLRAYCPVGDLGGSILLYRFVRPPSAAPGPSRPAALCPATDRGVSARVGARS